MCLFENQPTTNTTCPTHASHHPIHKPSTTMSSITNTTNSIIFTQQPTHQPTNFQSYRHIQLQPFPQLQSTTLLHLQRVHLYEFKTQPLQSHSNKFQSISNHNSLTCSTLFLHSPPPHMNTTSSSVHWLFGLCMRPGNDMFVPSAAVRRLRDAFDPALLGIRDRSAAGRPLCQSNHDRRVRKEWILSGRKTIV